METVSDFIFLGSKITADGDCSHEMKTLTPWKKSYDQPRQHIKKQRHYFVNKVPPSEGYGFSSGHVWIWELDYKESWVLKNWCFWTVVLEKTLESPLDSDMTERLNWTELMGPDTMILVFWMLSFKPAFSLSSFTFIKRLFSSLLSAIRVVSSAYLRLLIFLWQSWFQLVLHPAWHFTWCTLHRS